MSEQETMQFKGYPIDPIRLDSIAVFIVTPSTSCCRPYNSHHLLIECSDLSLMARTPAMAEAWMNEHVARYGGILAWRLIGNALAMTLDSVPAAAAAARGLDGSTLLLTPMAVSFLHDFPSNERLAGSVQGIIGRSLGSGTAFMEAMSASWARLQELPPAEVRAYHRQ